MSTAVASRVYPMSGYGPVNPASQQGPLREANGKYGRAVFVEELTTNLVTNSSFEIDTTGWAGLNSSTLARDTSRSMFGSASMLVTSTAGATRGAFWTTASLPNTTTYTFSAWVYVPSGHADVLLVLAGTAYPGGASSASTSVKNQWVRLTVTAATTAAGTAFVEVQYVGTVTAGQQVYLDGAQFEQKAYATSYCDGSLATRWDAPGNLLTTIAQSFEDGTTASAGVVTGTATLANSAAQFYAGTKSLLITATSTASLAVLTAPPTASPVTPGRIYNATQWVRPSAARQLRCEIYFYTSAGAFISGTTTTAVTGASGTWTRQASGSTIAPPTAAYASVAFTSTDATNGDTFYIDGQRVEEGSGATGYRWTGTENASTSTRSLSLLAETLPTTLNGPFTICARLRVGIPSASATGGKAILTLTTGGTAPCISYDTTSIGFTSNVDTAGSVAMSFVAGDEVFVAGILAADRKTYTIYVSKNGAALVTATSGLSGTAYTGATSITIGSFASSANAVGGSVSEVLVFAEALSAGDIASIAFSGDGVGIEGDPRIVLAALSRDPDSAATGLQALSAGGTGYARPANRPTQNPPVTVELGTPYSYSAEGAVLTVRGTAPLGIGVGEVVMLDTDGHRHTVLGVQNAGSEDLLYVN